MIILPGSTSILDALMENMQFKGEGEGLIVHTYVNHKCIGLIDRIMDSGLKWNDANSV